MRLTPSNRLDRRARWFGFVVLIAVAGVAGERARSYAEDAILVDRQAVASCEALASLELAAVTIRTAAVVAPGPFTPANQASQPIDVKKSFCRVVAELRPSSDSSIGVEVWMPVSEWNGKFQAVGNGAFNGTINYGGMTTALGRGYATASTDTGHIGGGAAWALGHPEKVIDFGFRAVHEMTVVAKRLVSAYYDKGPRFSYWNGCSAGGRQAMQEAQRFPADYDGIIAGAPGLDWTGRAAQAVRMARILEADERARLPEEARQLLHNAVVAACDGIDGVKDGLLENPRRCTFDPGVLECKGSERVACLTAPQVGTARAIYESPVNSRTGRPVPGLVRGSEAGWTDLGWTASARATGLDQFRYLVFRDPAWTIKQFDFANDLARAEGQDGNTVNALNPEIGPFVARGGKLLQYHGWSDPQISPGASTQYYERVAQALGGRDKVQHAYRLFMAPGMGHCGGGEGPNTFDMVTVLERWVEEGKAPDRIPASRAAAGGVKRTRPLCPYPSVSVYSGNGDINDEANFSCASEKGNGARQR